MLETPPASAPRPPTATDARAEPLPRGRDLLLLSATVLFLELALIRWGGAKVRVVAYFPNLLLIASFLGLGLGCLRGGRRPLQAIWMPSLLLLVGGYALLGRIVFTQASAAEHLWLLYYDLPPGSQVVNNVWLPVVLCFALVVLAFVAPGQMIAERLRRFQATGQALRGYAWDLGGSLVGVAVFTFAAFARLTPTDWFVAAVLASSWFFRGSRRALALHLACGAAAVGIVRYSEHAQIYSPYYALSAETYPGNKYVVISANGSLHQKALSTRLDGPLPLLAAAYHWPYQHAAHRPRRALVLGAGSGNDVSTLLQEGAEHIDAVEIDPVIIEFGRHLHPDHPYASSRVRVINTDARSFLNDSREQYDMIVFGTLDSMTRLSALSNVRLDNFVYTVECLSAARRHLTPDGGVVLYFMAGDPELSRRISAVVAQAFGESPHVHEQMTSLFNVIFLAGPAFAAVPPENGITLRHVPPALLLKMDAPNDDWPYLYLAGRAISGFYLTIIAFVAVLTVVSIAIAAPRSTFRAQADGPMFLYGFAFLLLETRAVTAMNLAWGGTWLTSAVVFGAILFTVLCGTLLSYRKTLPLGGSTLGLAVSLLVLFALPNEWLLSQNIGLRLALALAVVGVPVLFASTGFARLYDSRLEVSAAFGWNLLGAVAGGLCEFLSMITGLRALLILVLIAYLGAYLLEQARARTSTTTS